MTFCLDCNKMITSGSRCTTCKARVQRERDQRRGTPQQRGYTAEYTKNRAIILADGPVCHWCPAPATTADHLVPLFKGGSNELANLVPACSPCNSGRGGRDGNAKS